MKATLKLRRCYAGMHSWPRRLSITALSLLESAACADCGLGKWIRAAIIWGYVEQLRQKIGMSSLSNIIRLQHERCVASARAGLADDAEFDAAWRRGAAMTTEQAIKFVLRPDDT